MWETDLFARVSASDHQGVCRHYERDQKVPLWLEFWLRQTHVKCRWGRGALWFDWGQFYKRRCGVLMYPPVTHSDRYDVCAAQRPRPSRKATATRTASSSRRRSLEANGSVNSQSPLLLLLFLLWTHAQRASMLYFADVFYLFFYARLSWPNGWTDLRSRNFHTW